MWTTQPLDGNADGEVKAVRGVDKAPGATVQEAHAEVDNPHPVTARERPPLADAAAALLNWKQQIF